MRKLQQSTASQEIIIGPIVNTSDDSAYTTALTTSQIQIWKHGATAFVDCSVGSTHISNGYHLVVLGTSDTNTAGGLEVIPLVTGTYKIPPKSFWVEPTDTFAASIGSALAKVNATQINSSSEAAIRAAIGFECTAWGTVVSGTLTTTAFTSDLTVADDSLIGHVVLFRRGSSIQFQGGEITDSANSGGLITLDAGTPLVDAPIAGDVFGVL